MHSKRVPPSVTAFFPDARPVWPASAPAGQPLDRIDQIAILVADRDAAIDYFGAAFGWGPFYPATARGHCKYQGRPVSFELALAFTLVGDIELELVQPLTADNPYHDHLREAGEGIFHLRFATDAIEPHLQRLGALGIEPIFGWHEGQWLSVNLDSHQRFGVRSELILQPEKLAQVLAALGRRESVPHAGIMPADQEATS
jgi:hypothetical protein